MAADTPVDHLAEISKLMEAFDEHLRESINKMIQKVQKRYRHIKGSGIGEEHGHDVLKYLKSAERHMKKGEYKAAGVRIGDAMSEADDIEAKIG